MAATGTPTPNIGLRRPQGTDPASVDDINYNSNLLDTKLGAVGNTSVQEQINSLNSNIQNLIKTETINIEPDSDISPGTPGTRGAQKQISYNRPSGYTLLGAFVTYMYSSNSVIPVMFISNNTLYANWYRATSSSISQTEAGFSVQLVYAKI